MSTATTATTSATSASKGTISWRRLEGLGNPRGGEIVLVAALQPGREVEVKLPGRFTLDGPVRGALKTAPGVMYLEEL